MGERGGDGRDREGEGEGKKEERREREREWRTSNRVLSTAHDREKARVPSGSAPSNEPTALSYPLRQSKSNGADVNPAADAADAAVAASDLVGAAAAAAGAADADANGGAPVFVRSARTAWCQASGGSSAPEFAQCSGAGNPSVKTCLRTFTTNFPNVASSAPTTSPMFMVSSTPSVLAAFAMNFSESQSTTPPYSRNKLCGWVCAEGK